MPESSFDRDKNEYVYKVNQTFKTTKRNVSITTDLKDGDMLSTLNYLI